MIRPYHLLKIGGIALTILMMILAKIGTTNESLFYLYIALMLAGAGSFWIGDRVERRERSQHTR